MPFLPSMMFLYNNLDIKTEVLLLKNPAEWQIRDRTLPPNFRFHHLMPLKNSILEKIN